MISRILSILMLLMLISINIPGRVNTYNHFNNEEILSLSNSPNQFDLQKMIPFSQSDCVASNLCSEDTTCESGGYPGVNFAQWVYAYDDPALHRVPVKGIVTDSFMAYDDNPPNHWTRDRNFFVQPFPNYNYTVARPGNFAVGESGELGKLEVEWELEAFPMWAMPVAGDEVHIEGALVFDCGHGGPNNYRSEIHPPQAMMTIRKNMVGYIEDRTKPNPDIAPTMVQTPINMTQADIIGSSNGGDLMEDLECFQDFRDCNPQPSWYQPLTEKSYNFFIPAPIARNSDSKIVYQVIERPIQKKHLQAPMQNIYQTNKDRFEFSVVEGGSHPGVNVHINFNGFTPNKSLHGFGFSVLVGWQNPTFDNSDPMQNIEAPVRINVQLEQLTNNNLRCTDCYMELYASVEHISNWYNIFLHRYQSRNIAGSPGPDEDINYPASFEIFIADNQPLNIHARVVQYQAEPNDIIGDAKFIHNTIDDYGIGSRFNQLIPNNPYLADADSSCLGGQLPPSPDCFSITYSINSVKTDLLFVVDTTGSMATGLAAVKEEIKRLLYRLESSGIDYRIAIIDVKDVPEYPQGVRTALGFSSHPQRIIDAINGLQAGNGGDTAEPIYSGIMLGFTNSDETVGAWRPSAAKYVTVFTDTEPKSPEPFGKRYTAKDVINAAKALDPAVISAIVLDDNLEAHATMKELTTETGGIFLNPTSYDGIREALHTVVNDSIPPLAPLNGATVQFATSIITITEALSQTTIPVILNTTLPTTVTVPYQAMGHGVEEQAFKWHAGLSTRYQLYHHHDAD